MKTKLTKIEEDLLRDLNDCSPGKGFPFKPKRGTPLALAKRRLIQNGLAREIDAGIISCLIATDDGRDVAAALPDDWFHN